MMLKNIFQNLLTKYTSDQTLIQTLWSEIHDAHSQKSRHYHNLTHLENMFLELSAIENQITDLDSLYFSIFYHDIVYQVTRKDNEHQSALVFQKRISPTNFKHIDKVMAYIEATKLHAPSNDPDLNFLLDIDLSILGQPPEIFNEYCNQIRKEYHIFPDLLYKPGRKKVLQHFLDQERIFISDYFYEKYEKQARRNIEYRVHE